MTGLIYAVIIVLWGVVLVPRWLKRHDDDQLKNIDEIEATLNPQAHPHADTQRAASWSEYFTDMIPQASLRGSLQSVAGTRSTAALRRRKVLFALGVTTVLAVGGVMLGFLPALLAVGTTVLLASYVAAMAYQMRRGELAVGNTAPVQQQTAATRTTTTAAADGVRVLRPQTGAAWEPREATLPTYVNKPKATKVPRRIDLATGTDMVSEARRQQQAQYEQEWAAVEPNVDEEIERYADGDHSERYYRRAVNE